MKVHVGGGCCRAGLLGRGLLSAPFFFRLFFLLHVFICLQLSLFLLRKDSAELPGEGRPPLTREVHPLRPEAAKWPGSGC